MYYYIFLTLCYVLLFIVSEFLLGNIQGKYYFNHGCANAIITYLTFNEVYLTYTNLLSFTSYPINYHAVCITFALHFYHIIMYLNKLRFDDWLHHILMVVLALPLGIVGNSGFLLGHSLFFLTGLPGCIDYLLLFLTRNNYIEKMTEKKINNYINLWLRCPGCIAHALLSITAFLSTPEYVTLNLIDYISCFFTAVCVYWNGIYFMNQVVINYNNNLIKYKEIKKN